VPAGCKVDLAAFFARHGSRYPDTGAYNGWVDLYKRIQAAGQFSVTDPKLEFLKTWKPVLSDPDKQIGQVSPTGYKELHEFGATWRLRYSDLYEYNTPFTMWTNYYTPGPRVRDSARLWAQGFVGPNATDLTTIYALNASDPRSWMNSLGSSDLCKAYSDNGGSPYTGMWEAIYLPPILSRINAKLQGLNLTTGDMQNFAYLCGFETQITGRRSPFCDTLTEDEFLQYEYAQDLRYWYGTGLGSDIEKYQMLPIVEMVAQRFVDGPDMVYNNGNRTFVPPKIMANFANDGQINQLIAALGIFDNEPQLNPNRSMPERKFRASRQTMMRGTVAFERITCPAAPGGPSPPGGPGAPSPSGGPGGSRPSGGLGGPRPSGGPGAPYPSGGPGAPRPSGGSGAPYPSVAPGATPSTGTPGAPGASSALAACPSAYGNGYARRDTPQEYTSYIRILMNDAVYPVVGCTSGPGASCPVSQYKSIIDAKLEKAGDYQKLCNDTSPGITSSPRATFWFDNPLPFATVIRP
jgi:acid phosphatase